MQLAETSLAVQRQSSPSSPPQPTQTAASLPLSHYQIIRRNGAVVPFEPTKIAVALMKAFLAVHGTQGAASASVRETVDGLTQAVVRALMRSRPGGGTFHMQRWCAWSGFLLLRSALAGAALAVEHISACNFVVAAAHQAQLDLVLHVFDVESAAAWT